MKVKPLDVENASAHYDPIKYMVFIHYHGTITAEVTRKVYQWLSEVYAEIEILAGTVFDFQDVVKFDNNSLSAAQRQSKELNNKLDLNQVPTALFVANEYQKRLIQKSVQISPEQENKRLVLSMAEAFAFIRDYNADHGILQSPPPSDVAHLSRDDVTCHYDLTEHLVFITYFGEITPEVTTAVYGWIPQAFTNNDIKLVRGSVFNFCHVTRFNNANLGSVRKTSSNLNAKFDMSHVAVALLVGNMRQEKMVKVAMKVTPQEERKRIVKSYQDAYAFIEGFQVKRAEQTDGGD